MKHNKYRLNGILMMLALALLVGLAPRAGAADRYWIATSDGNWNDIANWSDSASGSGSFSVPGSSDIAYFGADASKDGNCSLNAAVNVAGINIGAGYDGTITQGAFVITVGSTGWTQAGGTFTGNASAITLNGAFALSGGTLNCGNQTITSTVYNWTRSGGTFNAGSGTVTFSTGSQTNYSIAGSTTFNNLTFRNSSTGTGIATVELNGGTLTVNGTLTFSTAGNSTITLNNGTIEAKANITLNDDEAGGLSGALGGTAALLVNGAGAQALTQTPGTTRLNGLPLLTINKSSGTLSLSGTILTRNNWTYTAGTIDAGTSTVIFSPLSGTPLTISGSHTLNNVTFYDSYTGTGTRTITIAGGTTLTIAGTTTFDCNGLGAIAIDTGTFESQGDVNVADANIYSGTAVFKLTGTADQTFTYSGGATSFRFSPTIDKPSGSVTLGSNVSLNFAGQDLIWTSGGLDLATYTLTVADQVTIASSATTLGVTVADATTAGRLTCGGAVSGLNNAGLAVTVTATEAQVLGQTYTILSNNTALGAPFAPETWQGSWKGSVAYTDNSDKNVTLSNVRLVPGGTVLVVQ